MRKISLIITILLTLFAGLAAQARTVSFREFVSAYLDKSYQLKMDLQDMKKAEAGTLAAKGIDDIRLSADTGYSYQNRAATGTEALGLVNTDKASMYSVGAKAEKVITQIGTRVSFSHNLAYIDAKTGNSLMTQFGLSQFSALENVSIQTYSTSLSASIIQPILKNYFGLLDRLPKMMAEIQKNIEQIYYQESVEQRMIESISLYLNWLYLYQQKNILQDIITNNQQLFRQTQEQVNAGIAEQADLEVARTTVISFEKSLLQVEEGYENLLKQMNKYLNIGSNDIPDEKILSQEPDVKPGDISPSLRSVQILDLTLKQLKTSLNGKKNSLLPQLDLITSYTLTGGDESFSSAYSKLTDEQEFFFGFQFQFPLSNNQARGELKQADADYQKMVYQREDTLKNLRIQEQNLRFQIQQQKRILQKQNDYIQSVGKKLADENRQYRQGMLGLREIVRTRNDLSNARLNLTDIIVNYHKLYYQYLELMDRMMEQYSYCIPDSTKKQMPKTE
jgi:outer membrane protein